MVITWNSFDITVDYPDTWKNNFIDFYRAFISYDYKLHSFKFNDVVPTVKFICLSILNAGITKYQCKYVRLYARS